MNAIVPKSDSLPAHLGAGKTTGFGNTDSTDLIIPRIKLLQPLSPEVEAFNEAKAGHFWHTILAENLGREMVAIPINVRKSYVLWAPRGDDRGILARANDAIHWDPPEGEFKVKFKQDPATYTWKLAKTVAESGLGDFGSSRPGDPKSVPAAALTYEFLFYFPELGSCALIINTRGSVKAGQRLISMVEAKPRDHYLQRYKIGVKKETGSGGDDYDNYVYAGDGYVDADTAEITSALYAKFNKAVYKANDEHDDTDAGPATDKASPPKAARDGKSKF
jgi:hypothetical protein